MGGGEQSQEVEVFVGQNIANLSELLSGEHLT
jgi:hypothetical protein